MRQALRAMRDDATRAVEGAPAVPGLLELLQQQRGGGGGGLLGGGLSPPELLAAVSKAGARAAIDAAGRL